MQDRVVRWDGSSVSVREIDDRVGSLMARGSVTGLALAVIEKGRPTLTRTYGLRGVEKDLPLEPDTVLYGASLTKLVFAFYVMQLVDDRKIDLDRPISAYLKKPLPSYPKYAELSADPRWKRLTARICLAHTPGFPNFRFINPNGKLDFKFDPGTRYAYSGEGMNLLQFVLEEGLGLDVATDMRRRIFDRFGMTRTLMLWRDDFAANNADGYDVAGKLEPHRRRGSARAAGSMDTTIVDYARFVAALQTGDGLSRGARAEMFKPQIPIVSAYQFPTITSETNPANESIRLASGLGAVLFRGPAGDAFFKGGHDDWTANMLICLEEKRRAILLLSNSVRAETIYPQIVQFVLGETGMPWSWEYHWR